MWSMQHGSQQLAEWIERSKLNQREAARKLGIHQSTLNKILKRTRLPGRHSAIAIRDTTGIPLDAWVETRVGNRRKTDRPNARKGQQWQGANA